MNNDWDDNWVFANQRFNLLYCDDYAFLQFLCEMIHPIVCPDRIRVNNLLQMFNDHLSHDGFSIVEKMKISGKPVFIGRKKLNINQLIVKKHKIKEILPEEYVLQQINRMENAVNSDDIELALGTSKELIDTTCKTILQKKGKRPEKSWSTPRLLKETANELRLTSRDIPDDAKGFEIIKKILGNLATITSGICELRNIYGTGHGKGSEFKGLSARHARLAVGAAQTLAIFLPEVRPGFVRKWVILSIKFKSPTWYETTRVTYEELRFSP